MEVGQLALIKISNSISDMHFSALLDTKFTKDLN